MSGPPDRYAIRPASMDDADAVAEMLAAEDVRGWDVCESRCPRPESLL